MKIMTKYGSVFGHTGSSGIKLKDVKSGDVYTVGAHKLSSAHSLLVIGRLLPFLLAFTLFFIH